MIAVDTIMMAIQKAKRAQGIVSLKEYEPSQDPSVNEYLLFIKPDLTKLGKNFRPVLQLILERLGAFEQVPVAASAVEASYLARHEIMSQHYGVIDTVSKRGAVNMSAGALKRLGEVVGNLSPQPVLLGGHQFLERFPYFSAQALAVMYDNLEIVKLGGGTYCARVVVRGESVLLFNGFHPEQLERYIQPGAVIVTFVLRTSKPWSVIRTDLTGATNPAKAAPESIRGALYAAKHQLGLDEVSTGKNGVHVSAGPIEGMVEIMRFMSNADQGQLLKPEQTTFGHLLIAEGCDRGQLDWIATNPAVQANGEMIPLFDLTEELDAKSARDRLMEPDVLVKRSN